MVSRTSLFVIGMLGMASLPGCKPDGKSEAKNEAAPQSPETKPVTSPETGVDSDTSTDKGSSTVVTGQVALSTDPSEIIDTIDGAVQSSFQGNLDAKGDRVPLSFAPGQVGIATLALTGVDDECADSGRPNGDAGELSQSNANYAAGRFYCLLRKNTYAPNSVQGAYYQNKAFLCVLSKQKALVMDGKARDANLDFADKDCFSDEFRALSFSDGLPPPVPVKVTVDKPSKVEPAKWDSSVTIDLPEPMGGGSIIIVSKTTETTLSSAAFLEKEDGASVYSMSLDVSQGVLRLDQRSYNLDSPKSNKSVRHYRLIAKGAVDKTYKFTTLKDFSGIDSDLYVQNDGTWSLSLHSFIMNFAAGGVASTRQCAEAVADDGRCRVLSNWGAESAKAGCYPGDAGVNTCANVTKLTPASDADLAFTLQPGLTGVLTDPQSLLKAGPLVYAGLTFGDLEE